MSVLDRKELMIEIEGAMNELSKQDESIWIAIPFSTEFTVEQLINQGWVIYYSQEEYLEKRQEEYADWICDIADEEEQQTSFEEWLSYEEQTDDVYVKVGELLHGLNDSLTELNYNIGEEL